MQLKDKVVFVTGGARGIGSACAKAVLKKGAKVVIADVNQDNGLKQTVAFKEEFGQDKVTFVGFDVTKADDFKEAFNKAVEEFGNIDVIINNAGFYNETEWEKTLDINIKGVIHGTELANAHMRKDKGGRGGVIINIASILGYNIIHVAPVYCASKHAVIGYTRCLASAPDVAAQGIRYACVCPDLADTMMVESVKSRTRQEYLGDLPGIIQNKELVPPSQVGVAVLTLLEDDDSNNTLLEVSVDGLIRRKISVETA